MRRYAKLLRIFWGNALSTELEYRAAFWANAFLSLFWLGWAALGARAYFRFAESVRGWTYDELLVVMGLFFAINGLRQAIIQPNLSRMAEYIRLGTLTSCSPNRSQASSWSASGTWESTTGSIRSWDSGWSSSA